MVDCEGNTALHHASRNTSHTIVDMLVRHNASLLQIANKVRRFPLTNAVVANNQVIVRALLDHGASADVRDGEGHSLIHYAAGRVLFFRFCSWEVNRIIRLLI